MMYVSVPCNWGTHSYCAKTHVVIRNYTLRSWAAGPLRSNSISPDQRSRTRFPLGDGSGVTTCPRGGNAQHLWPRTRTPQVGSGPPCAIRTPADGSGTSTCLSGLPRMGPGPPRAYPDPPWALGSASCSGGVRSRHVSRGRGRGHKPSAGSSLTHPY